MQRHRAGVAASYPGCLTAPAKRAGRAAVSTAGLTTAAAGSSTVTGPRSPAAPTLPRPTGDQGHPAAAGRMDGDTWSWEAPPWLMPTPTRPRPHRVAAPLRPIASPPTPVPPGGPAARVSGPPAGSFAATAAPSLPTAAAPRSCSSPTRCFDRWPRTPCGSSASSRASSLRPFSSSTSVVFRPARGALRRRARSSSATWLVVLSPPRPTSSTTAARRCSSCAPRPAVRSSRR